MPESLIANVSDTAFWVAHYRAVETDRPDALFRDPLARVLAGERGKEIAEEMPLSFFTRWAIVIRTCIIDEYIHFALKQGIDAVLNLGAGLDTRPYRMNLPSTLLWIEADYPKVIDYKQQRLFDHSPRCRLEHVSVNLANLDERRALLESTKSRTTKLLILSEGVIPYLSVEEVRSLAEDLKALDRVCYWIVDYHSPEIVKLRRRFGIQRRLQNAPFRFTPADWFAFFRERGWYATEIRYLAEEGERLQRPLEVPLLYRIFVRARSLFSSKERREELRKLSGYVLLEPAKH
ncbi:MAG: SAM-dependent methyltransferase [Terriglobales bacterium]|jgi:methyltransferase (TIGR00027 family)